MKKETVDMINVYSPVKKGTLLNQDETIEIQGLIARGSADIEVKASGKPTGEELDGGMKVDLPSLVDFCKQVLTETGVLPRWFFIGVIVDIFHNQIMTYMSPSKEKFFSDIYSEIQENLAGDLGDSDIEWVVKSFFENNRDFQFSYRMIPLNTLLTRPIGGKLDSIEIQK